MPCELYDSVGREEIHDRLVVVFKWIIEKMYNGGRGAPINSTMLAKELYTRFPKNMHGFFFRVKGDFHGVVALLNRLDLKYAEELENFCEHVISGCADKLAADMNIDGFFKHDYIISMQKNN